MHTTTGSIGIQTSLNQKIYGMLALQAIIAKIQKYQLWQGLGEWGVT